MARGFARGGYERGYGFTPAQLRRYRCDEGWTQAELAQRANVNAGQISQWESGVRYPSPANADALAEALGITRAALCESVDTSQ